MPTPDSPDGSDDPLAVAETVHVPTREVVPARDAADRPTEAIGRPTAAVGRPTEGITVRPAVPDEGESADPAERRTVLVDDRVLGGRETVKVPSQRRPPERGGRAPLPVAAGFAMLWAAVLSYVPVAAVIALARTFEGEGGLPGAAHAGLIGWLLGHGVPIGTSTGPLALTPLLVTLLVLWRLERAGVHVTRAIRVRHTGSLGDAFLVAFAIGLGYSLLGSLAGLAADGPGADVTPGRAAINFFVLGTAGSLAGSLRGTGAVSTIARRLPVALRHGIRAGLVASFFILAAGAAVTGLSVAISGGQAAEMISAFRTGVAGQAGITLVSLAYGVNGVIWAAAYLLGPGFALGTGSVVRLDEVTVGPLPTLPLLAGLPNGPMGVTGALLLGLPVLAGMAAGWLLTVRLTRVPSHAGGRSVPSWSLVLGGGLLAGPVAGLTLGLLSQISGGSLGDGRMATIGPDPWQVGLVAAVLVGVSAVLGAAAARTFRQSSKGLE